MWASVVRVYIHVACLIWSNYWFNCMWVFSFYLVKVCGCLCVYVGCVYVYVFCMCFFWPSAMSTISLHICDVSLMILTPRVDSPIQSLSSIDPPFYVLPISEMRKECFMHWTLEGQTSACWGCNWEGRTMVLSIKNSPKCQFLQIWWLEIQR